MNQKINVMINLLQKLTDPFREFRVVEIEFLIRVGEKTVECENEVQEHFIPVRLNIKKVF